MNGSEIGEWKSDEGIFERSASKRCWSAKNNAPESAPDTKVKGGGVANTGANKVFVVSVVTYIKQSSCQKPRLGKKLPMNL